MMLLVYRNLMVVLLTSGAVYAAYTQPSSVAFAFGFLALVHAVLAWRHNKQVHVLTRATWQKLLRNRVPLRAKTASPMQKRLQRITWQAALYGSLPAFTVMIVASLAGFSKTVTAAFILTLLAALLPSALPIVSALGQRYAPSKRVGVMMANATYTFVSTAIAATLIVIFGLMLMAGWHVPLPIGIVQVLLVHLLLGVLATTLAWDEKPHAKQEPLPVTFWFSLFAALFAVANYLLCFARAGLSIGYISLNNPFYFKATALAMLTLLLCQAANVLAARSDNHERFFTPQLWGNQKLIGAMIACLLVTGLVSYVPGISTFFRAAALSVSDWLWAIVASGLFLSLRLLQRHTRKHTRHAVIALHRKVKQTA